MSQEDTLKIPVKPVNDKPCEICGSQDYPNFQYTLVGITGVLCNDCLQKEVDTVNRALQGTSRSNERKPE